MYQIKIPLDGGDFDLLHLKEIKVGAAARSASEQWYSIAAFDEKAAMIQINGTWLPLTPLREDWS